MSELKTKPNKSSVEAFLQKVENSKRREDSFKVLELMKKVSGHEPKMWGKDIIGFGSYHYKYKSGREGDWFECGLSPRKQYLALHIMPGLYDFEDQLKNLGKYKSSVSCLYINKLEDVDMERLKVLIREAVEKLRKRRG